MDLSIQESTFPGNSRRYPSQRFASRPSTSRIPFAVDIDRGNRFSPLAKTLLPEVPSGYSYETSYRVQESSVEKGRFRQAGLHALRIRVNQWREISATGFAARCRNMGMINDNPFRRNCNIGAEPGHRSRLCPLWPDIRTQPQWRYLI